MGLTTEELKGKTLRITKNIKITGGKKVEDGLIHEVFSDQEITGDTVLTVLLKNQSGQDELRQVVVDSDNLEKLLEDGKGVSVIGTEVKILGFKEEIIRTISKQQIENSPQLNQVVERQELVDVSKSPVTKRAFLHYQQSIVAQIAEQSLKTDEVSKKIVTGLQDEENTLNLLLKKLPS